MKNAMKDLDGAGHKYIAEQFDAALEDYAKRHDMDFFELLALLTGIVDDENSDTIDTVLVEAKLLYGENVKAFLKEHREREAQRQQAEMASLIARMEFETTLYEERIKRREKETQARCDKIEEEAEAAKGTWFNVFSRKKKLNV